jgi:putative transcriptional regulator
VGLIINRPLAARPIDALPGILGLERHPEPLYQGGPVALDGYALLVLGRPPADTRPIVAGVHLGSTREVLERIATDEARPRFRVYVGHAGWAPGQLEREIAQGSWYLVDGSNSLVFTDDPAGIWHRLLPPSTGDWVQGVGGAAADAPWISSNSTSNTSVAPGRISGGKPVSP